MKSIIKSTFRKYTRKPVPNLINLLGLAISLSLVIILSVYCYSELTTDNFHVNGKRVYLYGSFESIYTPGILKDHIDKKVPEIESILRISGTWNEPVFSYDNREPIISDMIFADDNFFDFFAYKSIEGELNTALKDHMTVVITKSLRQKLFGNEKAVGKSLKLNNSKFLKISAVIEEPEANSCLSFSAITSMASRKTIQPNKGEFTKWETSNFQTFFLLRKGCNYNNTSEAILSLIPENKQKYYNGKSFLVPLKKLYFSKYKLLSDKYLKSGDKNKIMILLMVAVLVLVVALFNFINISSAQWLERVKQTGVMKVIGARRFMIIKGVLGEALLLFFVALCISIVLVNLINPLVQNYTGIYYNREITYSWFFVLIAVVGSIALSLVFSIIPALRISSSKAIENLKNTIEPSTTRPLYRGLLMALQFTIVIVLIAFTMLVKKQVDFGNESFVINEKNIIGIKLPWQLSEKREVLEKLLLEKPEILQISFTQFYPNKFISGWGSQMELDGEMKKISYNTFSADANFLSLMELELIQGRFYSEDLLTDKSKVIVNEAFLREHEIVDPIGKFLHKEYPYEIIGVVKDFHFKSVSEPITPLAIRNDSYASYCLVNLQTSNFKSLHTSIQELKELTSKLSPSFPVEISFFDQKIEEMYQSELQFYIAFSLFSSCAIVICCLGILAMSLFACQRRIKEIGVRKVNGAKVREILTVLNADFIKWVVLAFIIACPIAWYTMYKWLENFAYKTEINWWIFVLAGSIALVIALVTVSWQSWKVASRNPVEALRYE